MAVLDSNDFEDSHVKVLFWLITITSLFLLTKKLVENRAKSGRGWE
jgi:hypothetical protein